MSLGGNAGDIGGELRVSCDEKAREKGRRKRAAIASDSSGDAAVELRYPPFALIRFPFPVNLILRAIYAQAHQKSRLWPHGAQIPR